MANQASYLFSTRTSKVLAEKIAQHYGQDLGKIKFQDFSDGEFEPVLDQSVRGGRVFLIGSTFPPADNLLELLLGGTWEILDSRGGPQEWFLDLLPF